MSNLEAKTAVLGLGNVLMRDDALGPHVIAHLEAHYDFPENVAIEDLGTPGLDLVPYVADRERLIIVDTVRAEGQPGDLKLYGRDEILAKPVQARVSPHDPGVREAILSTEFSRETQLDVVLVGVIPEDTSQGVALSGGVAASVVPAAKEVVRVLRERGFEIRELEEPSPKELWWEKGET